MSQVVPGMSCYSWWFKEIIRCLLPPPPLWCTLVFLSAFVFVLHCTCVCVCIFMSCYSWWFLRRLPGVYCRQHHCGVLWYVFVMHRTCICISMRCNGRQACSSHCNLDLDFSRIGGRQCYLCNGGF